MIIHCLNDSLFILHFHVNIFLHINNFYTNRFLIYIDFLFFLGTLFFQLVLGFYDHLQVLGLTEVFLLFIIHRLVQYAVFILLFGS